MSLYIKKRKVIKTIAMVVLFLVVNISCKSHKTSKTLDLKPSNLAELEYEIKAKLGEGALWNHKTNELYWIDIEGKTLFIYNPKTKENKSYKMPSRIGTVVPYTENEVIVALEDGIYNFNLKSKTQTLFSNIESKLSDNRFNDGKCDPAGNFWVGSMNIKDTKKTTGSLYKITKDKKVEQKINNVRISNGIVWTKDGKTMYYIDTPTGKIRAYDYDMEIGDISNERVAVTIPESIGYPDGMTIDEEDMLWVGLWNGNGVGRFNPKTGELISKIEVPAHNVTACAFGGENLDTLYITTARVDMSDDELKEKPLSGSIFKVKPGVRGVKSSFFGTK